MSEREQDEIDLIQRKEKQPMEFKFDYLVPPIGGILDVAERVELDPTMSVSIPFTFTVPERQIISLNGQQQPTVGHLEFIALMSGQRGGRKAKKPIKIAGLTIGLRDQLLVTGHTGSEDVREVLLEDTDPGQVVSGIIRWERAGGSVLVQLASGQQEGFVTTLNLDRGGRVVLGVDEGSIEIHAKLATWPPSGSRITGRIITNGSDTAISVPSPAPAPAPAPVPAPPPVIRPPLPTVRPPLPATTPPVVTPTPSSSDKVLGLNRSDLILILKSILASFERGEEIDLRSVLAQVLAPILIGELLGRR